MADAKLELLADSSQIVKAEKDLDKLNKTGAKTEGVAKSAARGVETTAKSAAGFSRKVSQASIQAEQFFGQVASGGNIAQAASYQLADLGIVLGNALPFAIGAVALSLGSLLIPNLFGASEETKKLREELQELAETQLLTAEQSAFLAQQEGKTIKERERSISTLEKEIAANEKAIKAYDEFTKQNGNLEASTKSLAEQRKDSGTDALAQQQAALSARAQKANDELLEQKARLALLSTQQDESNEKLEAYKLAQQGVTSLTDEQKDALDAYTGSLQSQIIALQDGAQTAEVYAATQALIAEGLQEQIPEVVALIQKKYELKAADEAATQAAREQAQAVKEEEQAYDAFLKKLEQAEAAEVRAAEAKRSRLEAAASGTSGLTQLQVLEQQFEQEQELLLRANEAGIESKISYEERITELQRQYAEQRKQILDSEAGAQISYLSETESEVVGAVGQALGSMAQVAAQGGKDAFERYKALASAQALIAGFLAANKALAEGGPIAGPILATAIGITTAANVAAIQSQEYQARALGGQVNRNQPYLVGERGPELFTPNSSGNGRITPFNQLVNSQGGSGETVNKTANITFALPEGNADFRQRVSQNRDLFYNIVQQAMNDRGMRMGGRR